MSTKSIVNWINKTFDFTHLLKSRIVLYIFFILSIAQLYTYSVTFDYLYAAIFLLVGFLVSFFSKNMIVIMCFALSVSYMLKYGDSIRYNTEGMTTQLEEGDLKTNDKMSIDTIVGPTKVTNNVDIIPEILPAKTNDDGKSDNLVPKMKETKETKEVKSKDKKVDSDTEKMMKTAMSKAAPGMDKETQMEYKSLLELQLKLIDGISNMQPVLSEVAQKIDSMKKSMKLPN